jgi:hypothetical protein
MNLTYIETLEPEWSPFVEYLLGCLDRMTGFATLSVTGKIIENCEPFVQAAIFPNNVLVLEAVSDNYLETPLSMRAFVALRYLGWNDPNEQNQNHHVVLGPERAPNRLIARFLILTLRDVYGATPANKFDWEFD